MDLGADADTTTVRRDLVPAAGMEAGGGRFPFYLGLGESLRPLGEAALEKACQNQYLKYKACHKTAYT
eukprot:COSAG06_NODE_671_length_13206_cov_477.269474_8_plen_68_part_00